MIGPITTTTVAMVADCWGMVPCIAAKTLEGMLRAFRSISMLFWMFIRRSCKGFLLALSMNIRAFCQSFQYMVAIINPTAAIAGFIRGKHIWKKVLNSPAPSILAESISSSGILVCMYVLSIMTFMVDTMMGRISTRRLSLR